MNRNFKYKLCRIQSTAEKINAMTEKALEITWTTFKRHVDPKEVQRVFPGYSYRREMVSPIDNRATAPFHIKDDHAVTFWRGKYDGQRCYYICHSGIEYIFLQPEGEVIMELSKEKIDEIFEAADSQHYYWLALYQVVYPHWATINHIKGYPMVGKETHEYLFEKAIAFDKAHHRDVMAGGLWMHLGFGCDESVPEWHVRRAPVDEYKEGFK